MLERRWLDSSVPGSIVIQAGNLSRLNKESRKRHSRLIGIINRAVSLSIFSPPALSARKEHATGTSAVPNWIPQDSLSCEYYRGNLYLFISSWEYPWIFYWTSLRVKDVCGRVLWRDLKGFPRFIRVRFAFDMNFFLSKISNFLTNCVYQLYNLKIEFEAFGILSVSWSMFNYEKNIGHNLWCGDNGELIARDLSVTRTMQRIDISPWYRANVVHFFHWTILNAASNHTIHVRISLLRYCKSNIQYNIQ